MTSTATPTRPVRAGGALHRSTIAALGEILRSVDSELLRRVFGLGESWPTAELEAILGPLEPYLASGILRPTGDARVESTLQYEFFRGLLLASDRRALPHRRDHVLGVTRTARLAAACLPATPVDMALDLGTGSGVLGLLASRHAHRVVGLDVSRRAVAATRLNSQLNAIGNATPQLASVTDAAGAGEFDLVIANPPFVVSPRLDYLYRDSGFMDDGASRTFVEVAAAHLAPGGHAVVLVDWIGDGFERPRGWIASTGCSAWILSYRSMEAGRYADVWASVGTGQQGHTPRALHWSRWLEQRGIDRITSGVVVLQRNTHYRTSIHTSRFDLNLEADIGAQLVRGLAAQSLLASRRRRPLAGHGMLLPSDVSLGPNGALWTPLGELALDPQERSLLHRLASAGASELCADHSPASAHRLLRAGALELARNQA